jgi:serine/threonine-protein kinase
MGTQGTVGSLPLLEKIGLGGMATVYRSYDSSAGREVAIKVFRDDRLGQPSFLTDFLREAKLAATLRHPQIVEVYAVREIDGRYGIVMELLRGQTLLQAIEDRGALAEDRVVDIAWDVVTGLAAAAEHGLVHGDINPGNIFLTERHGAKILDFGLARLTRAAVPAGTPIVTAPPYCSPERLRGQPEDERSDMYSLGATLFEALTGSLPFVGHSPSAQASQRLSIAAPRMRSRRPELTPALDALVDRLLQVEPDQRFPDYRSLRQALRRAQWRVSLFGRSRPSWPW